MGWARRTHEIKNYAYNFSRIRGQLLVSEVKINFAILKRRGLCRLAERVLASPRSDLSNDFLSILTFYFSIILPNSYSTECSTYSRSKGLPYR